MNSVSEAFITSMRPDLWGGAAFYALALLASICFAAILIPAAREALRELWFFRAAATDASRKASSQALQHLLTHDSLTSLPNRLLLEDRIRQSILQANRRGRRLP
jgi:hypothetical protein